MKRPHRGDKRKVMLRRLVLAGLLLAMGDVQARECGGVEFPETIAVHGSRLALNGVGLRTATIFGVQVYVAGIYVGRTGTDPRIIVDSTGPTQLVMHFLRGLSAGQLRTAWSDDLNKEGTPEQLAPLQARLAQLSAWMEDVKSGQRLTFTRVPGEGLTVALDNKVKGTLPGDDFARAFLLIFLGDHPPTLEVKSGLLGGACG
jgi:hypothetical protein